MNDGMPRRLVFFACTGKEYVGVAAALPSAAMFVGAGACGSEGFLLPSFPLLSAPSPPVARLLLSMFEKMLLGVSGLLPSVDTVVALVRDPPEDGTAEYSIPAVVGTPAPAPAPGGGGGGPIPESIIS